MSMTALRLARILNRHGPLRIVKLKLEAQELKDSIKGLTRDKMELLHEVAQLRNKEPTKASLEIIDSLYRQHLDDTCAPHSQSILSAIINGALDDPPPIRHTYAYSRRKAISLVDPTLREEDVDEAGHHLYHSCMQLNAGYSPPPVILRETELAVPSIAAFFALAHFCDQAEIRVEYQSESGSVYARLV
ncbi:uncharacterized protein EV420DRAFT_1760352 [Desarmillaria tabescens]|uniref:Uncharacterized protein n=1 Tax=Armillaria tabescens TaxID=1929756 RepID=A0AA39NES9_ARMTA|nr:uncharacterized protein EV420DRAFT_1760352 [Desarmillaria tabescens]KAK0464300.1 hypothetical protein EV420DRAFT_1760352 [Desarmillaria tabescens]